MGESECKENITLSISVLKLLYPSGTNLSAFNLEEYLQ